MFDITAWTNPSNAAAIFFLIAFVLFAVLMVYLERGK